MIPRIDLTLNKINQFMQNNEWFYFNRFGDGDLTLIAGASSEQRHSNSPRLKRELVEAFSVRNKKYLIATSAGTYDDGSGSFFWMKTENEKAQMSNYLQRIVDTYRPTETFCHTLFFQYMLENDKDWFNSFANFIREKKVLLIAGEPICDSQFVTDFFGVDYKIPFPLKEAYYQLEDKWVEIVDHARRSEVILPVIGMATRVVAKRLWKMKARRFVIDIGVSMDALSEATHRAWTKRIVDEGIIEEYKKLFYNEEEK